MSPALQGPDSSLARCGSTISGSAFRLHMPPWVAPTAIHVQALRACRSAIKGAVLVIGN